jgi:hypothetical protein
MLKWYHACLASKAPSSIPSTTPKKIHKCIYMCTSITKLLIHVIARCSRHFFFKYKNDSTEK